MMQLLYSLNDKDKIVVDDDGFVFIDYENKNEIIKDVATDTGADDQNTDTDTEEPTYNPPDAVADTKNPVVYTEDIIIENTLDTQDTQDTQDIVIEDTKEPVVYTQDIVIEDNDDTKCNNSLDKKNN
jgi:hypothetical protein